MGYFGCAGPPDVDPSQEEHFTMPTNSLPRRSVLSTAAWTVPVVATAAAAPMAAASQCVPASINWNDSAVGARPTTLAVPGVTPTLTATFAVTYGGAAAPSTTSGTIVAGPQGGSTDRYYRVEFLNPEPNNEATVTITFNRAVRDVNFTILDIDATNGGYRDSIVVNTPGFTATPGPRVQGAGTTASPFQMNTPFANIAPDSNAGNLRLNWAGPLTSVSFRYFQPNTAARSANMVVGISGIGVNPC